jgi:quinol-cytochrome oxidoreductase complex cytochrome b subunit
VIFIHLLLLHRRRSRRSLIVHERERKIKFTPYYSIKDSLNILLLIIFRGLVLFSP